MTEFEFCTLYRADYKNQIQFGPIRKQDLWSVFTDGRVIGLLNEKLLTALFNNVSPSPSNQSSYDVLIDGKHKCEVRSVTKKVNLIPSKQIGTGRKFDEEGYRKKRECVHAYIFVDVMDSPEFSIIGLLESDLPFKRSFTRKEFLEIVKNSHRKKMML